MTTKADVIKHIREHSQYPSTKGELVANCNKMSDVPVADREWFEKTLPEKTYYTADEVIRALNL